ncbi:hypothetical protein ABIC28_005169 [Rhodococcus sp. PvR044]|uniref:hypothetical protein n=1 Tax=Rhodococcus sp. PvR044 TaxID=3156402 RepID=UPI0033950FC7
MIESARLRFQPDDEPLFAEDLVNLDQEWVESVRPDFICPTPSCDARVVAVLTRTPPRRRTPHFRNHDGVIHQDDCVYAAGRVDIHADGGEAVDPDTGLSTYASRLGRRTVRTVTTPDTAAGPLGPGSNGHRQRTRGPGSSHVDYERRRTVYTIRPLCRAFIDNVYQREHMIIDVPEITTTSSYLYAFKRLWRYDGQLEPRVRIFYGELRYRDRAEETDETTTVWLHAGTRENRYNLVIDHADWTAGEVRAMRRDLHTALAEAEDCVRGDTYEKTWAFFIGRQDTDRPATFHITDSTRICFITATIEHPQRVRPIR